MTTTATFDQQLNRPKKITQLTKVVYRLNTCNENHRSEKQLMLVRHQLDLQHVARDAASKIAKFKDFVEGRKVASGLEAQIEDLLHHMAKEKHDAKMALVGYKQYIHEREIKLGLRYQYTIEQQQKDIRHMHQSFQEKMALVSGFTDELSLALQAQKANMFTSAMNAEEYQQELRRKHEQDMTTMSINHNQQLQHLRSKHQHEIDQLTAEYRDRLQREETVLQNACNDEITSKHVLMCDDRQQAIVKLRKEGTYVCMYIPAFTDICTNHLSRFPLTSYFQWRVTWLDWSKSTRWSWMQFDWSWQR